MPASRKYEVCLYCDSLVLTNKQTPPIMADSKVDQVEAATNPTTDEPKNAEQETSKPVPSDSATVNDAAAEQLDDSERKPRGPRTYDNGMLKTSAKETLDRKNNSKYDPSVLQTTDNPKEIRGQVGSFIRF